MLSQSAAAPLWTAQESRPAELGFLGCCRQVLALLHRRTSKAQTTLFSAVLTPRAAAMQVPEPSLARCSVDSREAAAARMTAAAQEAMEELRRRVQAAAARAGAAAGRSVEPATAAEPVAEAAQPAAKVQDVQPLAPMVCLEGETGMTHVPAA